MKMNQYKISNSELKQIISEARSPIKEIVEQCLEGMITKDEAFDKIALLLYER